jgi:hypothetical protein
LSFWSGVFVIDHSNSNNKKAQQQQYKKKTVRDILTVSMDYVGCGKVTKREWGGRIGKGGGVGLV